MNDDFAITVKNVYKNFKLPHEKADSVKSLFVNPFNKNRKKYETQHALHDISFEVKKGEFFGIVGRNGSGKSTLLKIIAGIYQPNKGSVSINGRLVPFIELGVGFNPELTGRENVYLNGALLGFSEKEVDKKYKSIVDFAELDKFMDQKLKNYSSGMQVRLAFSVATVLAESDILLIDEVLAVGDSNFQRKCFEYFKKLKKDKKTVIFVSHDMSAIREYCDRVILIDNSKVVSCGNSEDISKEYLKLFNTNTTEDIMSPDAYDKWGTGDIDISDVCLSKKLYNLTDEFIDIEFVINNIKNYDDTLNPGIVIKNEQGEAVCGTNAKISCENSNIKFGNEDKIIVFCSIPNIFSKGKFTGDIAVLSSSTSEVLQWFSNSISFSIDNNKSTPYIVSPKIEFTFKNK